MGERVTENGKCGKWSPLDPRLQSRTPVATLTRSLLVRSFVTKDAEFAEWSRLREPAPAVLWLRIGNLKKVELRAKLVPLWPELLERLQAGETLIEVF